MKWLNVDLDCLLSHPSRVRGLKLDLLLDFAIQGRESHPSRVRGLKFVPGNDFKRLRESHPSRVRGLKLIDTDKVEIIEKVAPFTGAWIEIG